MDSRAASDRLFVGLVVFLTVLIVVLGWGWRLFSYIWPSLWSIGDCCFDFFFYIHKLGRKPDSGAARRPIHSRIELLLLPTVRSISYSDIISFSYFYMAERVGFEPTEVLPSSVFRTDSISHSDISPYCRTSRAAGVE